MTQIHGLWWPDDVGAKWEHALRHVRSLDWMVAHCPRRRTAVQAGGNVGLWPRKLAQAFARVITFEPDAPTRECLVRNVPPHVEVLASALGGRTGQCALVHKSLGSHHVCGGDAIPMGTVDDLVLTDLDCLQLDVEGYERHVLAGAAQTIQRCLPMIQLELRQLQLERYGSSAIDIRAWLGALGYRQVSAQPGSDYVFAPTRRAA